MIENVNVQFTTAMIEADRALMGREPLPPVPVCNSISIIDERQHHFTIDYERPDFALQSNPGRKENGDSRPCRKNVTTPKLEAMPTWSRDPNMPFNSKSDTSVKKVGSMTEKAPTTVHRGRRPERAEQRC
jgi:hypothetical protein